MPKALWIIAAASGLAAAAAVAFVVFRRVKKNSAGSEQKQNRQQDDAVLLEGLARHAALYDGLYEGIYQSANRADLDNRDAFREWCGRTAALEEDTAFVQAFAARFRDCAQSEAPIYREHVKALLELIRTAGIVRRPETELILSPETRKTHIVVGEPAPADGALCRVVKPSWEYAGQLIEQGILMVKEDA